MGRPTVAERFAILVGSEEEALLLGLQALADPTRLRMVRLLAEREQCVCHLTEILALSQASISHHIAVLKRAGLIEDRRDTHWTYYRLASEATFSLRRSMEELLVVTPANLALAKCCDTLESHRQEPATKLHPQLTRAQDAKTTCSDETKSSEA